MGRSPCCAKVGLNRGTWSAVEDRILTDYINANGEGNWRNLPKIAGLKRCGKSCRLRWMNYLRPSIKRGNISPDEEDLITRLHKLLGNRWSLIAGRLPGRTDNEIKNYWNTILRKKVGAKPTAARKTKRSDAATDAAGGTDGCRPHAASGQAERTRASTAPEPRSPLHPPPIRTKPFRCTQAVTKMFMSTQQPPPSDNAGGRCPDDYEEEGPPACDPPTYTLFRSNSFTLSSFLMEEGGDRDPNDNSLGFFVSDDCTTTGTCRSNQQLIGSDRPIHVTEELDDGREWSSFDLESLIHFLDKED